MEYQEIELKAPLRWHEGEEARVIISTRGATVRSFYVPVHGQERDVLLGPETEEEWGTQDKYFNATIGRVANRLGKGHFVLEGKEYQLATNNGPNSLHGGIPGFDQQVFSVVEQKEDGVRLRWISQDGEAGYPGTLQCEVEYRLEGGASAKLYISYQAVTDQTTLCNLTWHGYWNVDGAETGSLKGQRMQILADRFTALDADSCPTGEILSVENTGLDFRTRHLITDAFTANCAHIRQGNGIDHNYILQEAAWEPLKLAAMLWGKELQLQVYTTQPGMQVYTANYLDNDPGKGIDGKKIRYPARSGICFETQAWPDAIHHAHFPSIVLHPGQKYEQQSCYVISPIAE